jgi:pteridine reductase
VLFVGKFNVLRGIKDRLIRNSGHASFSGAMLSRWPWLVKNGARQRTPAGFALMIEWPAGGGRVAKQPLQGKTIFVTGASRRIGRALALACADAGADVIIHYFRAREIAAETLRLVQEKGRRGWLVAGDFSDAAHVSRVADESLDLAPVYGLVNNAAIFGQAGLMQTARADWDRHIAINLTAPFLLAQAFARKAGASNGGRVVNILDWRALRPGADHFAYTVTKAALASMTRMMAAALAPEVTVNGLALGAILPNEEGKVDQDPLARIPAKRWGTLDEVGNALLFLLAGPAYVTGEVIYVDGGRHLI